MSASIFFFFGLVFVPAVLLCAAALSGHYRQKHLADKIVISGETLRTIIKQAAQLAAGAAIDTDRLIAGGMPINKVMAIIKDALPDRESADETAHLVTDIVVAKRAEEMRLQSRN